MDLKLTGKVVLITGGSRGIGFACGAAFLAEGAKVALVSRSDEHLKVAAAQLHSAGDYPPVIVRADLAQPDEAHRMAAEVTRRLGPIDVLINSAGAAKRYLPEQLDASAWHAAMQAKYFTYIHAMDAVLPDMLERGGGAIVNIIGTGGKIATPIHLPGGAANSALMLASVGLAHTYGPRGIRINAINPGATKTDRVKEQLDLEAQRLGVTPEQVLKDAESKVPMRRFGDPEEVANVALFLASPRASYVTGAIIPMDGGLSPVI